MTATPPPIVTVEWLQDRIGDPEIVVTDVRPADAYRAGHIPGAIHADLGTLRLSSSTAEVVAAWSERLAATVDALGFGAGRTVVFYEDLSGPMAGYGVWLLDAAGLGNGAMLDGGMRAWLAAGNASARDDVTPRPTSTTSEPDANVLATAGQLLEAIQDRPSGRGMQIVDTRAAHEYGMGAIPGAINIEWSRNLDDEGRFRPTEDLAAMYEEAGITHEKPVAAYCAGGFRAANTYVALKAIGYESARNYAPSWGEWGTRPDTPVERP